MNVTQKCTYYFSLIFIVGSCMSPRAGAQGQGTFVGAVNYPAGAPTTPSNTGILQGGVLPADIHTGDFNGDGRVDAMVVATCTFPYFSACPTPSFSSGVVIAAYLSNGDGTFQPPILSSTNLPGGARSSIVGDFNNDGKLDVAVAADCSPQDCTSGTITILLGNGDGTFTQSAQYPLGGIVSQAGTLAVGDFNSDRKLDLAVGIACYNIAVNGCSVGAVAIFAGNGDGTLAAPTIYSTVGNNTLYPIVGDFNGDGKLDVIAGSVASPGDTTHSSLTILLGAGNGTFTESISTLPFGGLDALAAGDFNSDGKLDLAIMSNETTLQILAGNGNGTFQAPLSIPTGLTFPVTNGNTIVVTDLNGDGKPDLVISGGAAESQLNGIQVFLNDGTGKFMQGASYPLGGWEFAPIVLSDFDGDGKTDVVMASGCSESVTPGNHCPDGSINVLFGNGDGTFQGPLVLTSPAGGVGVHSGGAADFNGDGILDLFASSERDSATGQLGAGILLGNPDGTYQPAVVVPSGVQEPIYSLAADFNNDGKQDLAILNACDSLTTCNSPSVSILLGNGDGTFQAPVIYPVGGSTSVVGIVTGDFNGDRKLDVAVATQCEASDCNQGTVSLLLGNGDGTFQNAVTTGIGSGAAASIAAGDFDRDGNTDVVVGSTNPSVDNPYAEVATILLSNGDGTLRVAGSYDTGGAATPNGMPGVTAVTGDINHDGKLDVVIANGCESPVQNDVGCANGSIGVLLGNGDGTFQQVRETVVTDGNLVSANIADVDADGNLDLIASTTGGVMVARGNGDGTFQTPIIYGGLNETQDEVLIVADINNDGAPDIIQPDNRGNLAIFYNRGGKINPTISISNIPVGAVYGGSFTPTYAYSGDGITSAISNTPGTCTVSNGGPVELTDFLYHGE